MDYTNLPDEDREAAQLVKVGEYFYKYGQEEAERVLNEFKLPFIIDYENSNDLGIVAVHKKSNKASVVFRGTDPGITWGHFPNITDLHYDALLFSEKEYMNPQYVRTKWLLDKAIKNYEVDRCVGYSKGANHCYTWADKYNINSTTFNGAFTTSNFKNLSGGRGNWYGWGGVGYNYLFGSGKRDETKANHKIYRIENDPVSIGSKFLTDKSHPNIDVYTIKGQEIYNNPHKIEHFFIDFK